MTPLTANLHPEFKGHRTADTARTDRGYVLYYPDRVEYVSYPRRVRK